MSSGQSFFRTRLGLLALVLWSVVIATLLLETAIRIYDLAQGHGFSFFSTRRNLVAKGPTPIRPFRTFGSNLYHTKQGIRWISDHYGSLYPLEKPEHTFRVVVFGGSTSVNRRAHRKANIHYPGLLESKLRQVTGTEDIEVINAAYSAYSTSHSLILFTLDVLSWSPDLIIVSHNINDLTAAYWPDFTFDYSNKYSHEFYNIPDQGLYSPRNILLQHFELYWIVRARVGKLFTDQSDYLIHRKSYGNELPRVVTDTFRRNLRSFVSLAKANDIHVAFGTQAFQPDEATFVERARLKSYNSVVAYPMHDEFVKHHAAFNHIIQAVARDSDVILVDNSAHLKGDPRYFFDSIHYTPAGVERLAQNYADHIISSGVMDQG